MSWLVYCHDVADCGAEAWSGLCFACGGNQWVGVVPMREPADIQPLHASFGLKIGT